MRLVKWTGILLLSIVIAAISFVYLAPERALHMALDAERQKSGLARKQIDLPDGTRYVYLEGGQGEPLMLLHGFGGDKDNFTRVASYLTPHYRVVIPDHVGFGESAHPKDADYSPPAQAKRLHELAQALHLQNPHLGGNSMGGQIAMTYAALYPAEVKSLWLLDPAGVWSAPEAELGKIIRETGHNPLVTKTTDDFAGLFAFVMNDPPFIPGPMIKVMAQARIHNFDLEQGIFKQIREDDTEKRVKGLATPALIVWGGKDRLLNVAAAEILHQLLTHSQVTVMPNIGHMPMLEAPQRSAEDYLKFRITPNH